MKPEEQAVTLAAASLSGADITKWNELLSALETYKDNTATLCVHAPVAELQVAQGRAQGVAVLYSLLNNARKNAEKMYPKPR